MEIISLLPLLSFISSTYILNGSHAPLLFYQEPKRNADCLFLHRERREYLTPGFFVPNFQEVKDHDRNIFAVAPYSIVFRLCLHPQFHNSYGIAVAQERLPKIADGG